MSVLGVVVRVHPKNLADVRQRLAHTPGVDMGPDAGDGRLVAVIESTDQTPAAAIMARSPGRSARVHRFEQAITPESFDELTAQVPSGGQPWEAVVDPGLTDAPGRGAASRRAALVEQEAVEPGSLEPVGEVESGQAGSDDADVH